MVEQESNEYGVTDANKLLESGSDARQPQSIDAENAEFRAVSQPAEVSEQKGFHVSETPCRDPGSHIERVRFERRHSNQLPKWRANTGTETGREEK